MALSKVCWLDKISKQNKYRIQYAIGDKFIVERNFYLLGENT